MSGAAESLVEQFRTIAREEARAVVKAARKAEGEEWVDASTLPKNMARQARADARDARSMLAGHATKIGASTYFRREPFSKWLEAHEVQPRRAETPANDTTAAPAAPPASAKAPTTNSVRSRLETELGIQRRRA